MIRPPLLPAAELGLYRLRKAIGHSVTGSVSGGGGRCQTVLVRRASGVV